MRTRHPVYASLVLLALAGCKTPQTAGSSRLMLVIGLSILVTPLLLGALADEIGLRAAHLLMPALIVLAFLALLLGQVLQRAGTSRPAVARATGC